MHPGTPRDPSHDGGRVVRQDEIVGRPETIVRQRGERRPQPSWHPGRTRSPAEDARGHRLARHALPAGAGARGSRAPPSTQHLPLKGQTLAAPRVAGRTRPKGATMTEATFTRAVEAFRARVGLQTPMVVLEGRVPCLGCGTLVLTEVLLASASNLTPATLLEPVRRQCLHCESRSARSRAREAIG